MAQQKVPHLVDPSGIEPVTSTLQQPSPPCAIPFPSDKSIAVSGRYAPFDLTVKTTPVFQNFGRYPEEMGHPDDKLHGRHQTNRFRNTAFA